MRAGLAPWGRLAPPTAPASGLSSATSAGILITIQCHQPEPVGASGSYTVTAKLLVPLGAPFHASAGDLFSPAQPKPLNSKRWGITPPALMSELVKVKPVAACATEAAPIRAATRKGVFIRFSRI